MIDPLFAWSWDGHGRLTAFALAAAITQLIKLGKGDLMKRFHLLHLECVRAITGGRTSDLYKDLAKAPVPSSGQMENALRVLFRKLPERVQEADLHAGNIPMVGEWLDSNGQVRHFMRSTDQTPENEAYLKSVGWIRGRLTSSWDHMKDALYKKHDFAFYDVLSSGNAGDFFDGLSDMAEGLHTIEDSYAPGHVRRSASLRNRIEAIHYWDDDNKKPHGDWPGHEALDNPESSQSRDYFEAAQVTTTELIVCVLTNLDGDKQAFALDLRRRLDARFHLALGASGATPP